MPDVVVSDQGVCAPNNTVPANDHDTGSNKVGSTWVGWSLDIRTTPNSLSVDAMYRTDIHHSWFPDEHYVAQVHQDFAIVCLPSKDGCGITYQPISVNVQKSDGPLFSTITISASEPAAGSLTLSVVMEGSVNGTVWSKWDAGSPTWQCSRQKVESKTVPVHRGPPPSKPERPEPPRPLRTALGWLAGVALLTGGLFGWLLATQPAETKPTSSTSAPSVQPVTPAKPAQPTLTGTYLGTIAVAPGGDPTGDAAFIGAQPMVLDVRVTKNGTTGVITAQFTGASPFIPVMAVGNYDTTTGNFTAMGSGTVTTRNLKTNAKLVGTLIGGKLSGTLTYTGDPQPPPSITYHVEMTKTS